MSGPGEQIRNPSHRWAGVGEPCPDCGAEFWAILSGRAEPCQPSANGAPKSQTDRPEAQTSGRSPVELLRAAGPLLYGDLWQSAAADLLGVSRRTINNWLAGRTIAPARIGTELQAALRSRLGEIQGHLESEA
jgi:hypothetical protein